MKDNHHLYIGIDRSDASIDICALHPSGEKSAQSKINTAPEALLPWIREIQQSLPAGHTIANYG